MCLPLEIENFIFHLAKSKEKTKLIYSQHCKLMHYVDKTASHAAHKKLTFLADMSAKGGGEPSSTKK